jgi:hypothetical protein
VHGGLCAIYAQGAGFTRGAVLLDMGDARSS